MLDENHMIMEHLSLSSLVLIFWSLGQVPHKHVYQACTKRELFIFPPDHGVAMHGASGRILHPDQPKRAPDRCGVPQGEGQHHPASHQNGRECGDRESPVWHTD